MAASFMIADAKTADDATKLLIFGYIRNMNVTHKISENIPDLICFVTLLYYMVREYFDKPGKGCQISEDKLCVTREKWNGYHSTTYCKLWINSLSKSIVTWKLKIANKQSSPFEMMIGVTSSDTHQSDDFSDCDGVNETVYAFTSDGHWSCHNGEVTRDINSEYMAFTENDEIAFTLDLKNREILFQVNQGNQNVIWTDIDCDEKIQYKFAVCLPDINHSMQLIGFSWR